MIAAPDRFHRLGLPPANPFRAGFLSAEAHAFTAFADEVERAMDGRPLRYSQRLHLLKVAEYFGIRRFDANLIIAMVQNRVEGLVVQQTRDGPSAVQTIAMFVAVQSAIVIAGWLLLF